MIYFKYGDELNGFNYLKHSMFKDRAEQFSTRLGWAVSVDSNGEERDEYDWLNPLYVIVTNPDGSHAGSMRFLPTVNRTMVNEHFLHLTSGAEIRSPLIWECTRFCVSQSAGKLTAAKLMAAGGKIMFEYSLKHFIGVFDQRMERVYRMIGSSPIVLGREAVGCERTSVGLWEFDKISYCKLLKKANVTSIEMELFWVNSAIDIPDISLTG